MLITYPNYDCAHCYSLEPHTPDCETKRGCPVGEELAADPDLNDLVGRYLTLRMLYHMNEDPEVIKQLANEFGFYDDLDLYIATEKIFAKFVNKKRDEQRKR